MKMLIDRDELLENSFIDNNIENEILYPAIRCATKIQLKQVIGQSMYDAIMNSDKYDDDEELMDNIKEYLIWATMSELQIPLSYKIVNMGVVNTNDEKITNPQIADIQYLKNWYNSKSLFYGRYLYDYLCYNNNRYTEFNKEKCFQIKPTGNINTGLVL